MTKVKICGITNLEDALLATKFGADALGFNFYEKSPRFITPEKAREIIEKLPPEIFKVGVFVNETSEKIGEIARLAKLDAIQLHGEETPEFAAELKSKTELEIIKAFRVAPDFQPSDVLKYEVDAILLDAYSPHEYGGTGETFDREIAKQVQAIFPKMYLAGGLNHENVFRTVGNVKPFAVDACSGIEITKGKKDKIKLINFLTKAKKRLNTIPSGGLFDFLDAIRLRPEMYLEKNSILHLHDFLSGSETALILSNSEFDTEKFFSQEFKDFVGKFFNEKISGEMNWSRFILRKFDNNEESALDAFFAILEEFKLEKDSSDKE